MAHPVELFEDFILGTLAPRERQSVELHASGCSECRERLDELEESLASLGDSMKAPDALWRRLDASLLGPRRFAHLVEPLAGLFELSVTEVEAILARVDVADAWEDGMGEGVKLMPVAAGPGLAGVMTALLRLEPGATFPGHAHGGEERVLVLEGGYLDSTGVEMWRGDLDVRAPGTSHSFTALPGPACVCASVYRPPEDER